MKKPSSKKQGGRRERARIIRRLPVQKPEFAVKVDEAKGKEQGRNERVFLLTWLGLRVVILVEGLGLASSATSEEAFQLFNLFEKRDMFQQLNLKFHRQQVQADLENVARLREVVARLEIENEQLRRSQACDQTEPQPITNHSDSDSNH